MKSSAALDVHTEMVMSQLAKIARTNTTSSLRFSFASTAKTIVSSWCLKDSAIRNNQAIKTHPMQLPTQLRVSIWKTYVYK